MEVESETLLKELNELMANMKQVDSNLAIEGFPQKVMLLLGDTKAGKTTLMYYLLGKQLIYEQNEDLGIYQMKPEALFFNAHIGNTYQSATVYPNIPTQTDDNDVLLIDMPGFNDTRPLFRLLNIYILRATIRKLTSIHVSIVLPYESLQKQQLISAVQKSCLLLKPEFLQQQDCLSIILTKIQDCEEDLRNFNEELTQQKEYYEAVGGDEDSESMKMTRALNALLQSHTYYFQNKKPDLNQGKKLRSQIVEENKFFVINQDPNKILAQKFFENIAGDSSSDDYIWTAEGMVKILRENVHKLVHLFFLVFQHHYRQTLAVLGVNVNTEQIRTATSELAIGDISLTRFSVQDRARNAEDVHINFIKKLHRNEGMDDSVESQLEELCRIAVEMIKEEGDGSRKLREKLAYTLKYSFIILQTIQQIKLNKIIQEINKCFSSTDLISNLQNFFNFADQNDIRTKILQNVEIRQLAKNNQVLKDQLLLLDPNLILGDGEVREIIETVPTYGEIKHRKFLLNLQQTKKSIEKKKNQGDYKLHGRTGQSRKLTSVEDVANLPISAMSLDQLLQSLATYESDIDKGQIKSNLHLIKAIFGAIIEILMRLNLIEEAVIFSLAICAESVAENLLNIGITSGSISPDFIRSIILPYFSEISLNFSIIQKMYNALYPFAYTRSEIIENEKEYVSTLKKMHKRLDKKVQMRLKRFELDFVRHLLHGEGLTYISEVAERNEILAMRSGVTFMREDMEKLKNIC